MVIAALGRRSKVCGTRWLAPGPGLSEWVTWRLRWASLSDSSGLAVTPPALMIGAPS